LKIPNGYLESVNRSRTDSTMAKRTWTKRQTTIYTEYKRQNNTIPIKNRGST